MRRSGQSRFRSAAIVVFLVAFVGVLIGCGGSGGSGSGTPVLSGKKAQRSVAIGGVQSLAAGQNYPLLILQNSVPGKVKYASARAVVTPTFVPELNLYEGAPVYNGSKMTITFYTDSQGKNAAGSLVATNTSGQLFDSYSSYPATVNGVINLTAGNIPCTGNFTITFTDAHAANAMKGTVTLANSSLTLHLDLTLDDSGNVGGSLYFVENGLTVNVTSISGPVTGTIKGEVKVAPYGWTGQGTFSLATGAFSVTLNTSGSNFGATLTVSGSLDLTYGDGSQETVTNPITSSLTGGGGTTGSTAGTTGTTSGTTGTTSGTTGTTSGTTGTTSGTTGTTSGTTGTTSGSVSYYAPSLGTENSDSQPVFGHNQSSNLVGAIIDSNNNRLPAFWGSPTLTPLALHLPSGSAGGSANGINDNAQIVGYSYDSSDNKTPLLWGSSTATPIVLPEPAKATSCQAMEINDAGNIAGLATINGVVQTIYWTSQSATPVILKQVGQGGYIPTGLATGGAVLATNGFSVVIWSSSSATAYTLTDPNGSTSVYTFGMNVGGDVCGYSVGLHYTPLVWLFGATKATPLKVPSGYTDAAAFGMNDLQELTGYLSGTSGQVACIWTSPTAAPVNLNTAIPKGTGWTLVDGGIIFDSKAISGFGNSGSQTNVPFYMTSTN